MRYLRRQPPHGFFLTPPHLRGPGTAASSQGAMSGLGLGEREPLSIWTQDSMTVSDSSMQSFHTVTLTTQAELRLSNISQTVQFRTNH